MSFLDKRKARAQQKKNWNLSLRLAAQAATLNKYNATCPLIVSSFLEGDEPAVKMPDDTRRFPRRVLMSGKLQHASEDQLRISLLLLQHRDAIEAAYAQLAPRLPAIHVAEVAAEAEAQRRSDQALKAKREAAKAARDKLRDQLTEV